MLIISIPIALLPAYVFSSAFSRVTSLREYFSTLVHLRGHFAWYLVALLAFLYSLPGSSNHKPSSWQAIALQHPFQSRDPVGYLNYIRLCILL